MTVKKEWVPILEALDRISAAYNPERFERIQRHGRHFEVVTEYGTCWDVEPGHLVEVLIEDES